MSDLIDRQAAINLISQHTFYDDYDDTDKCSLVDGLRDLPSAQPEPCEDAVSRQAVYNVLDKMPIRGFKKDGETIHGLISLSQVNSAIINLPSAQPEMNLDEWCTDCKEYDKDKHCCPRWNKVIRQTLKDMKEEQPEIIRCKDCKYSDTDNTLGVMFCWRISYHEANEDGFCSWAERRTDDLGGISK